jgi:circadian clock protein KaiC
MAHSNQSVEYRIDGQGVAIVDTYVGPAGVLTGSARVAKEAEDRAALDVTAAEIARKEQDRERRRHAFERRLAELREEFEAEDSAVAGDIRELALRRDRIMDTRAAVAQSRGSFAPGVRHAGGPRRRRSR